eukprot:TRINITY_DN7829_c3_g1_i1.p2 TRINITY_DN7829_c3_g1~~TRINITY_DN7829_c3_g1_i1.p2  ORF type:complete len:209 (+),score=10.54 TRINITY_DN7829_c3_g1_i1:31-657(+)
MSHDTKTEWSRMKRKIETMHKKLLGDDETNATGVPSAQGKHDIIPDVPSVVCVTPIPRRRGTKSIRKQREDAWYWEWVKKLDYVRQRKKIKPRVRSAPVQHVLGTTNNFEGHWCIQDPYCQIPQPPYPKTPRMKQAYTRISRPVTAKITYSATAAKRYLPSPPTEFPACIEETKGHPHTAYMLRKTGVLSNLRYIYNSARVRTPSVTE